MSIAPLKNRSELQAWFRNKYGIHINIHWHGKFDFVIKIEPEKILNERLKTYETYEECLEEALKWSLKYLAHEYKRTT